MEEIIYDIKFYLTFSFLVILDWMTNFIVGAIFLILDLESLKLSKEYASILVWYVGAISCSVYLVFRAYNMIMKAFKSRIEKKMAENKLKESEK